MPGQLPVEPISLNYAKINWKYTPVGINQLKHAQPLTGQSDREQLRAHLVKILLMNSQSAANQNQSVNLINNQQGKNTNRSAGRMLTKRIRHQDNHSRSAQTARNSGVDHQLQSALTRIGMTIAGARQILAGHSITNKTDRELLREILTQR